MIGLGLALSAKHVFDDHRDALARGDAELICLGVRPHGALDIWRCYAMNSAGEGTGDLELLSLMLVSDWPADDRFMVLPLTTRIPHPGEELIVAGFRLGEPGESHSMSESEPLGGLLYVSKGQAGEFSYPIRDRVLAPYPTIEVFSGSLGGMSGGAVLDVNGHVVGIVSVGLSTEDHCGHTLAAWWMPTYFWRVDSHLWPAELNESGAALWSRSTVEIVGREYVEVLDEPNFNLTRWT